MLSGTVTDPQAAVVGAATLDAENIATGVKNRTISNETGSYLFAALPPGTYRIRAIGPGFRQLIYQGVELPVGARLQLNLKIELGEVTESLQVTAESDNLLGYNTASVGGTISG